MATPRQRFKVFCGSKDATYRWLLNALLLVYLIIHHFHNKSKAQKLLHIQTDNIFHSCTFCTMKTH